MPPLTMPYVNIKITKEGYHEKEIQIMKKVMQLFANVLGKAPEATLLS
jgi:phenylpyruvate tautomerase PptA (4-oxalocrotonate tautomerase family)